MENTTPNEIYHGQRYDIPADVWATLLKIVKEIKESKGAVKP